jgi:hypothetical protein
MHCRVGCGDGKNGSTLWNPLILTLAGVRPPRARGSCVRSAELPTTFKCFTSELNRKKLKFE